MADTVAAPNNKAVAYQGKTSREPAGVDNVAPMKAAKPKQHVRKSARKAMTRGLISERAAQRHLRNV